MMADCCAWSEHTDMVMGSSLLTETKPMVCTNNIVTNCFMSALSLVKCQHNVLPTIDGIDDLLTTADCFSLATETD